MACAWSMSPCTGAAQVPLLGIIRTAITRAIVAADQKIQRLQARTMRLQEAEKRAENELSRRKLQEISSWVGKLKDLYAAYFRERWNVWAVISGDFGVQATVERQRQILRECAEAPGQLQQASNMPSGERALITAFHQGILNASAGLLDRLLLVIRPGAAQMTDAERLEAIRSVSARMDDMLASLRSFDEQCRTIATLRANEKTDVETFKTILESDR